MKKNIAFTLLVTTGLALAVTGCVTSSPHMRQEVATRLASPAWLVKREIPAGPFALTAYERMHTRFASADVYIEGDGTAWVSKKRMSLNPTPKNPVALHLATRDNADNVAYLSRPCQYSGMLDPEANCSEEFWTGKRYSPEVLAAYNAALDEMKTRYDIEGFNLVGFSGGGTIAALLAAQRSDILSIRTVAGNLDHKAHSAWHQVAPLDASLNPPDFADTLKNVPQYHFIGGQDEVVPPAILHSYLQSLGPTACVQYKFIQEAEHEEGWVDKWPELLALQPTCAQEVQEVVEFEEFVPEPIITPRDPGNFK
jgi:dienelactone hydrolase